MKTTNMQKRSSERRRAKRKRKRMAEWKSGEGRNATLEQGIDRGPSGKEDEEEDVEEGKGDEEEE